MNALTTRRNIIRLGAVSVPALLAGGIVPADLGATEVDPVFDHVSSEVKQNLREAMQLSRQGRHFRALGANFAMALTVMESRGGGKAVDRLIRRLGRDEVCAQAAKGYAQLAAGVASYGIEPPAIPPQAQLEQAAQAIEEYGAHKMLAYLKRFRRMFDEQADRLDAGAASPITMRKVRQKPGDDFGGFPTYPPEVNWGEFPSCAAAAFGLAAVIVLSVDPVLTAWCGLAMAELTLWLYLYC